MKRKRVLKVVTLCTLVTVAIVMASAALAQIYALDDDLVYHLADIEDYSGYLVTDREGYIAVFYKGHGQPAYITHTPLSTLRGVDREDVKNGIIVATRTELMELLEDLGS